MPAPSITVTPDPTNAWVRLDVDCKEFVGRGDYAEAKLWRTVAGVTTPVRVPSSSDAVPLSNGGGTFYDTEAPLDTPVSYKALFRSLYGIVSPNASFEDNITGWAGYNCTVAQSATRAFKGTQSLAVTGLTVTPSAWDNFVRAAVASGWGTPNLGGAWLTSGGAAADYSTDGAVGKHSNAALNTLHVTYRDTGQTDLDLYVSVSCPVVTTGASARAGVVARYTDANNHYAAVASFNTANSLSLILAVRKGGTETTLSTVGMGSWVAGTLYRVRYQIHGAYHRVKLWTASTAEPTAWNISYTDTTVVSGGQAGCWSRLTTGLTNALPVALSFDDYQVVTIPGAYIEGPRTPVTWDATVQASTVAQIYSAGGENKLSARLAQNYYDPGGAYKSTVSSTAPFDLTGTAWTFVSYAPGPAPGGIGYVTALYNFVGGLIGISPGVGQPIPGRTLWVDVAGISPDWGYAAQATLDNPDINSVTVAAPAPVTVASGGAFWLKDPLRPGNSVKVLMDLDYTACAAPAGVVFLAMDAEKRAAASAAFDTDWSTQPIVLAKPRKDVEASLSLLAATFADRDRLEALLAPGSPLLFQGPAAYGIPDRYISVGDVGVGRLAADHRKQWRVFSLPFVAVAAPVGPAQGVAGTRWKDLCNRYATWADITAAGWTWKQVKQGQAG